MCELPLRFSRLDSPANGQAFSRLL